MTARIGWLGNLLLLAAVACGGSTSTPTTGGTLPVGTTAATVSPTTAAPAGSTTTIAVEPCMEPSTEIDFGETTDVTIPDGASRVYLCVQVPNGVASLRFEVPDVDGLLTLYVGYPTFEKVQHGGFEGSEFWRGEDDGGAWVIALEPLVYSGGLLEEDTVDEFVRPGSYYIEVDGPAGTPISVTVSEG